MLIAFLPRDLGFLAVKDLVRVGNERGDGGYLCCKRDLLITENLVSLGVSDDWSFESDLVNLSGCKVSAFDASISARKLLSRVWWSLPRLFTEKNPAYWARKYLGYQKFFGQKNIVHYRKFVRFDSIDGKFWSLNKVFAGISDEKVFLKIDIEGSEYGILDEIIAIQARLTGCVIEFHMVDVHLERIVGFIEKFSLRVCHIHANNYASIRLSDGLPEALEISFTSQETDLFPKLPHQLDKPNSDARSEIKIELKG